MRLFWLLCGIRIFISYIDCYLQYTHYHVALCLLRDIPIILPDTETVFTCEISFRDKVILVYGENCLHVFAGMKFQSGMNPCLWKRNRDDILSWDEKKKMCKHFLLGRNLTISMFLLNFWRIYSICFPTLTCLYKVKVFKKYIIGRAYKKWSPKYYYSINYLFLFLFLFLFCKVYKRLEVPFALIIIVKFHVFY